jgi:hypothetical protein
MDRWDPIGVKDASEAADEYDGYRGGVIQLLRSGASGKEIAEYLSRVEQESMGLGTGDPSALQPVGDEIVRWYVESVARWEASHPAS